MWTSVKNNSDIEALMYITSYFHDSCVKEMRYVSGAYVNSNLCMHAINDQRILKVILQRQCDEHSMIELEFSGIKFVKLIPIDEEYTCEILKSSLFIKDGYIYWGDSDCVASDLDQYDGTLVCAKSLRWRTIQNCMGKEDFYCSRL